MISSWACPPSFGIAAISAKSRVLSQLSSRLTDTIGSLGCPLDGKRLWSPLVNCPTLVDWSTGQLVNGQLVNSDGDSRVLLDQVTGSGQTASCSLDSHDSHALPRRRYGTQRRCTGPSFRTPYSVRVDCAKKTRIRPRIWRCV